MVPGYAQQKLMRPPNRVVQQARLVPNSYGIFWQQAFAVAPNQAVALSCVLTTANFIHRLS